MNEVEVKEDLPIMPEMDKLVKEFFGYLDTIFEDKK